MDLDGFLIESEVKESSIPNAGKGRFFLKNYNKGKVIRIQELETDLHVFKDINDINDTFIKLVKLAEEEGTKNFKLMDFVGFLPQIIDVEDGNYIVDCEEQQREREWEKK